VLTGTLTAVEMIYWCEERRRRRRVRRFADYIGKQESCCPGDHAGALKYPFVEGNECGNRRIVCADGPRERDDKGYLAGIVRMSFSHDGAQEIRTEAKFDVVVNMDKGDIEDLPRAGGRRSGRKPHDTDRPGDGKGTLGRDLDVAKTTVEVVPLVTFGRGWSSARSRT